MEKEQNNGSVHNSATGSDVADDQAVAADISARDEYNPNWKHNYDASIRQTNAHKALQIALQDVIHETITTEVTKAIQNYNFSQHVQDALDVHDFSQHIQDVLDDHDFNDIVSDALDNYDVDSVVTDVMEDRFGELFRQHVKRLSIDCER